MKDIPCTAMGSCGSCNKPKCSWCVLINKTSTFTGARRDDKVFEIFHTVTSFLKRCVFIGKGSARTSNQPNDVNLCLEILSDECNTQVVLYEIKQ